MGTKINAQTEDSEYAKAVSRYASVKSQQNLLFDLSILFALKTLSMAKILVKKFQQPWLGYPKIFSLSALGKEHDRMLKTLHGFTENVS